MRRVSLALAVTVSHLAVCGTCFGDHLIWRGCGVSKTAFMEACAAAYEQETGIPVMLSGGGATLGIETAATGGADLGGTCRACLASRGEDRLDIKLAVVAWDALAVVVHPDNPVKNISHEQLRDVLQQRIKNWKQLGGADSKIVVVAREGKTSGVGYSTRELILNDRDAEYGKWVIRKNSSGPIEKFVERQPRAIAVTGVSSANKRDLAILSIDGHRPTFENIASGAYPYFRPLYVAYKPDENPGAKVFVKWLLSDAGQAVVKKEGTVGLKDGAALTARYRHFGDTRQIANYDQLLDLAKQANRKSADDSAP